MTLFQDKKSSKIFWGGSTAPSPDPTPSGEGDIPSPNPTLLGAYGASFKTKGRLVF